MMWESQDTERATMEVVQKVKAQEQIQEGSADPGS